MRVLQDIVTHWPMGSYLVNLVIGSSLLALTAWLAVWITRKQSPLIRYWVLLIFLAASLLVPASAYWTFQQAGWLDHRALFSAEKSSRPRPAPQLTADPPAARAMTAPQQFSNTPPPSGAASDKLPHTPSASKPTVDVTWLTFAVVLIGVVGAVFRAYPWIRAAWIQTRLRQSSLPVQNESLLAQVRQVASQLGLPYTPDIRLSKHIATPVTLGPWHPLIVWPHSLQQNLSRQTEQAILIHEMAHLVHRHHWASFIQVAADLIYWWNPLIRGLSAELSHTEEEVCDRHVVAAQGQGVTFAELLLQFAESRLASPAGLGMFRRSRGFERRIHQLIQTENPNMNPMKTSRLCFVVILALVTSLAGTVLGFRHPSDPQAREATADRNATPHSSQHQSSQDSRQSADSDDPSKPPSITYPFNRKSTQWVSLPNGTRVAVDDGIEWEGTKIYLSLTWNLVAVDQESKATLWGTHVSAFWNQVSIEKIRPKDQMETWAIALRNTREHGELVEYRDLKTGEKLQLRANGDQPSGNPIELAHVWSGGDSLRDDPFSQVITSEQQWRKFHRSMFEGISNGPPEEAPIDFQREFVWVISSGKTSNCSGIGVNQVFEDAERILLRLSYRTYQSIGDTPTTRPYGVFVLPKHVDKKYVVERNHQRYIGGPPLWNKTTEFSLPDNR